MNGRFWIFGIIVSVIVHVGFLAVLSFSSKGTSPSSESVPSPSSESASSTVPEPVPAALPEPTPAARTPVPRMTRPASTPVARPPARSVTLPAVNSTPVHEPAPTPETEWVTYTVKKGDWLERLCKKAGCSVSEAARYNKTTYKKLSNLKVGQKIKLPKFQDN